MCLLNICIYHIYIFFVIYQFNSHTHKLCVFFFIRRGKKRVCTHLYNRIEKETMNRTRSRSISFFRFFFCFSLSLARSPTYCNKSEFFFFRLLLSFNEIHYIHTLARSLTYTVFYYIHNIIARDLIISTYISTLSAILFS